MDLDALISEYFLHERALSRSMNEDGSTRDRARFLRRCADLLEKIEQYAPKDARETKDKIYFFLNRAITRPGLTVDGRDINIALTLCEGATYPQTDAPDRTGTVPAAPPAPNLRGYALSSGIINYVRRAPERVSLIDADYRYIATSSANAAYYNTQPVRMIGMHVADVIGEDRFLARAKKPIDACVRGEPQEYYHTVDKGPEPDRLIRYQMKPVYVPDHSPGYAVIVYVHDITNVLKGRIRSLLV